MPPTIIRIASFNRQVLIVAFHSHPGVFAFSFFFFDIPLVELELVNVAISFRAPLNRTFHVFGELLLELRLFILRVYGTLTHLFPTVPQFADADGEAGDA